MDGTPAVGCRLESRQSGPAIRASSRRCRVMLPLVIAMSLLCSAAPFAAAQATHAATAGVTLTPSVPSGQPVGTLVAWTAAVSGSGSFVYQFSLTYGATTAIVRDYSTSPAFLWMPMQEGTYSVTVSAKSGFGATTVVSTTAAYVITSRVTNGAPVVNPTVHPLVALYSAPPCAANSQMKVAFRPLSGQLWASTAGKPCRPGLSMNFLIAGMRPNTPYLMRHVVYTASTAAWSPVTTTFTTGALPGFLSFPTETITPTAVPPGSFASPVLFESLLPTTTTVPPAVATDLYGRVVWYYSPSLSPELNYPDPPRVLRVVPGGTFLVIGGYGAQNATTLAEVNLAGIPVRETTVSRVDEQLAAMGQPQISGFHHDAIRLPNGDTAVLGYETQTVSGTSVLGDMVVVLDANFQVKWAWNSFASMSPLQYPAVLGETCSDNYSVFCPASNPQAQDWLHSNAIGYSPADDNLIVSMRDQDAIVKIQFDNGTGPATGDGHVMWRLGKGGDFTINSSDPSPWFSHQHDPHYIGPHTLILFDNGNTRCQDVSGDCDSRGQVLQLDEANMAVTPTVNVDVGSYSSALGSAQQLSNGNFTFTSGAQQPGPFAQSVEIQPGGSRVYLQQVPIAEYRSYRLPNLYTAPDPLGPSAAQASG